MKLWFVWDWLRKHPDENFRSMLRNRVDIFRKTEYYDPVRMNQDSPDFDVPGWSDASIFDDPFYLPRCLRILA
ncbi:MAG TPA: hypothetical protein DET40_10795 [Lentisphaeria bacterium]|nr:MAG: hypothetical protein A2X45_11540 [Lentisphaerae bacterium GWF2_50_93]HCE44026.1 hypothetical protein [Lentisphaeria bacterium]